MAGRFPRSFAWILIGLLMLATFSILIYEAGASTTVLSYTVAVSANDSVTWTVTVPSPIGAQYTPLKSATVQSVQTVSTIHGEGYNVTGRGNGTVCFTLSISSYDLNSYLNVVAASPALNGTYGFAWVARGSSNASQPIQLSGTTMLTQSRADEQDLCSGVAFAGALAEGWNELGVGIGACTHATPLPSLSVLSVPFLLVGLGCTYVGIDRGRKFRWEK